MSNLFTFGNLKLPKTTMIFNMGEAINCPSRHICVACNTPGLMCYAEKAERMNIFKFNNHDFLWKGNSQNPGGS